MKRIVRKQVKGYPTQDGAGVNLVRVLGNKTVDEYDPILMLDSFDSTNPEDYTAGFPMHPHRGIETVSYLAQGKMQHRDHLGYQDTVVSGEIQWMTAGSGIFHEEKLPPSERLLGVQLWLNLPADKKMVKPEYHAVKKNEIPEFSLEKAKLRLLAGKYDGHEGYQGKYLPLNYYDIDLEPNAKIEIKTENDDSVMLFTLLGEIMVEGEKIEEKTAAKLTEGDAVVIETGNEPAKVLFIGSKPLKEEVYWGGPIVMNTESDLMNTFAELRDGTFIKEDYKK